jgi:hypothetical protein
MINLCKLDKSTQVDKFRNTVRNDNLFYARKQINKYEKRG